jgi:hypothetical protein
MEMAWVPFCIGAGVQPTNQGYPFFYDYIKFLISYCIFTFNYSNNLDLATQNKFIFENIVDI